MLRQQHLEYPGVKLKLETREGDADFGSNSSSSCTYLTSNILWIHAGRSKGSRLKPSSQIQYFIKIVHNWLYQKYDLSVFLGGKGQGI